MVIRFGGLATGIDTEKLIQDMMRVQRLKVDRVEQQKTLSEWQREAYNKINRTFANFILESQKSFGFTQTTTRGGLLLQSVSSLNWVKSATPANQDIVKVSARADAMDGTYNVEVVQLASNWSAASKHAIAADKTVKELLDFEGKEIYTFTLKTGKTGEEGIIIELKADDTMATLAKKINDAGIGVAAQYDRGTGLFFLQTKETGSESYIEFGADAEELFIDTLGLRYIDGGSPVSIETGKQYTGKNAIINFGAAENVEFQSNHFSLNGINFELKSEGSTTITVGTDVDGVYEKIKEFVENYNALLDVLNLAIREEKYRNFPPLTKEQKEAMSEKEIEAWESKAKSGLLRNDLYISSIISTMRSGLYEAVGNTENSDGLSLFNFGITTERYSMGSTGGKLVIDEEKLKDAIRNDVNQVLELFFAQPDSKITDQAEKRNQTGIVSRLYGDIIDGMKRIITKAGPGDDASLYRSVDASMLIDFVSKQSSISLLDRDIQQYGERIDRLNAQLARVENRLWAQFVAMEKAIGEMNSRAAWLTQQLGGGQ